MKTLSRACALLLALPCIALAGTLPDTGQTKCYDSSQEMPCPQPGEPFYGQDAQYGPNLQSYTKLDADGNELPDGAPWPWAMVKDDVTGLVWETKTDDGSIHDKDNEYDCWDAKALFIATLNSQSFAGYSDWRLPALKELANIVTRDAYDPSVNTLYFPNTVSSDYWSSDPYSQQPLFPPYLVIFALSFYSGSTGVRGDPKSGEEGYAQAVHGQQISNNFIVNGDGTVTDTNTCLMWQQDTAPGTYAWEQALSYCENLLLAGWDDWRLPNANELHSIVDYSRYTPAIDITYFPNTETDHYWTSTTYVGNPTVAWLVDFYDGGVIFSYSYYFRPTKSDAFYVRAVRRGGESDSDCDGILNENDTCPYVYNPDQLDTCPPQGNGIGDACECEGNFSCSTDQDVDGTDAATFKVDFGRSTFQRPCIAGDTCNGDFTCDGDVDGTDAALFKQDFGRSQFQNPCPSCTAGVEWCQY